MNVPEVKEADVNADQCEVDIDVRGDPRYMVRNPNRPNLVKGTRIFVSVPFTGDQEFFFVQPSISTTCPPRGAVGENELFFSYDRTDHDAEAVRREYQRDFAEVQQHLARLREDVKSWNDSICAKVKGRIEARRQKLLKDQGMVAALGLPLRRREGAPQTYTVPTVRRKLPVPAPRTSKGASAPEPTLAFEDYEHILSVIQNMVLVMERSPHTFKGMKEEDLRQHFLVQLNGQYEGQATGETFNFEGKTDILIRAEGKNIFIAECKFWDGPKAFAATIDQLTRYISWRDTKTAIILFNRTKGLTSVLEKIPEVVRAHPTFKREESRLSETAFRFRLHHRDDPKREIILTVLVFEIPS